MMDIIYVVMRTKQITVTMMIEDINAKRKQKFTVLIKFI